MIGDFFIRNSRLTLACIILLIGGAVIFALQFDRTPPTNPIPEEVYIANEETPLEEVRAEEAIVDETYTILVPVPIEIIFVDNTIEVQAANLQKLAMVWGFTKYTHLAFLTGERCWDEELFDLIPIIRFVSPADVNDILFNWYIGLGDDGFDNVRIILHGNTQPLICMEWLTDEAFLGNLATVFSRFNGIRVNSRRQAPVMFDQMGTAIFSNQGIHPLMDASDDRYRLLGLFRLWNAMKYYFPYIDIIDDCWHELLFEHNIIMLEGTDSHSYQRTLASIASRLHDPHIRFSFTPWMFDRMFGEYVAPLRLTEAEGQLVVFEHVNMSGDTGGSLTHERTMEPGDVILGVNSRCIDEVVDEMLQYVSYPNRDKALFYLATFHRILRQHSPATKMQLDVLRDGVVIQVAVETVVRCMMMDMNLQNLPPPGVAHMILENNIGLINTSTVQERGMPYIMASLAYTDGLIVDLRQYPAFFPVVHELPAYLVETHQLFSVISGPSRSFPGVFNKYPNQYSGGGRTMWQQLEDTFFYENNVVVLMNERSFSRPEFAILSLRNGANVTVMGTNSMGSNGDVRNLPLPGGVSMSFSSLGIFSPEGGQTQRIGLEPDIWVERTIAGIREGRDELMEAAIQFLLDNHAHIEQ